MANYSVLKAAVQAVVKTNGNQEITGANMQSTLISIINSLGTGYQFMGVATPSTSPGTPDYNVAYIGGAGTYANFGTSVTVPVGSICVFKYNGSWAKEQIALFAGIDEVPTANSNNLVKSGGVCSSINTLELDVNGSVSYDANITGGSNTVVFSSLLLEAGEYVFTIKVPTNAPSNITLGIRNNGSSLFDLTLPPSLTTISTTRTFTDTMNLSARLYSSSSVSGVEFSIIKNGSIPEKFDNIDSEITGIYSDISENVEEINSIKMELYGTAIYKDVKAVTANNLINTDLSLVNGREYSLTISVDSALAASLTIVLLYNGASISVSELTLLAGMTSNSKSFVSPIDAENITIKTYCSLGTYTFSTTLAGFDARLPNADSVKQVVVSDGKQPAIIRDFEADVIQTFDEPVITHYIKERFIDDVEMDKFDVKTTSRTFPRGGQKLIGAIYFGGIYCGVAKSYSYDDLVYNIATDAQLPNKSQYDNWVNYVHGTDGNYPTAGETILLHFPFLLDSFTSSQIEEFEESAQIQYSQLTSTQKENLVYNRKPFYGWRQDTVQDMEAQIELASEYGIDYFIFDIYLAGFGNEAGVNVFNQDDSINDTAFRTLSPNLPVFNFISSTNCWKMKFAVNVCDDTSDGGALTNSKRKHNLAEYISETFMGNSSYLYMNGSPVLFVLREVTELQMFRTKGNKIIMNSDNRDADGRFVYSCIYRLGTPMSIENFTYLKNECNRFNEIHNADKEFLFNPVSSGFNNAVHWDYVIPAGKETNCFIYGRPSKEDFESVLKTAVDNSNKTFGDRSIIIYAWNENGEGGWLPPTYCETTTTPNDYPVLVSDVQQTDGQGNPLYFDFWRLECVKAAKEYWNKIS